MKGRMLVSDRRSVLLACVVIVTVWAGAAVALATAAPAFASEGPATAGLPSPQPKPPGPVRPRPAPSPSLPPSETTPPAPPHWKTIGYSLRGRPIKAIVFGDGGLKLLIIGGTHGNEYGAPVAKAFARWLITHLEAVPDGAQVHIIRCQNPDGLWAWTRGNARRVDLNRNFPSRSWTSRLDPRDPSGMMGLTGGARPGSEPETRAVLRYLRGKGFDRLVGLHSTAGLIDWNGPGGRRLALRMARLCRLPVGHLGYQPYIHGSLGQFFPERYGKPTITVELRSPSLTRGLRLALLAVARR